MSRADPRLQTEKKHRMNIADQCSRGFSKEQLEAFDLDDLSGRYRTGRAVHVSGIGSGKNRYCRSAKTSIGAIEQDVWLHAIREFVKIQHACLPGLRPDFVFAACTVRTAEEF